MIPPSRRLIRTQTIAAFLVVSMLVGVVPLQLFLAPAMADGTDDGSSNETRGLLPSDETFDSTEYRSIDSSNNTKKDAIRVRFTVSTTAAQEPVSVLIKVTDGNGNTVKVHYENFTAYRFGSQDNEWIFYAYYTGYYQVGMVLFDSQNRQEDTDSSGVFYLDTGTVKRWITIGTTRLDLDKDSFKDDVEVHVTNWTDKDVKGARVWINSTYVGTTNSTGKIIGRNYHRGWINVDVFWKDLHNGSSFQSAGDGGVSGGLTVRAEVFDEDGDDLEDDVTISVTNQLGLPVRNVAITFNGTDQDTTDISGELEVLNVRRGFWIVNATKLNNWGSTNFFSEGQGAGTETDEYFFDIEVEVVDVDNDDRKNDVKIRFDVDVDPAVESTVTVWANLSWWGNDTAAHNVSITFTTNGTDTDWNDLIIKDVTYGLYLIRYELLDSDNNSEDLDFDIVEIVRPSNHVNMETGVFYEDDDNEMDDTLFRAVRVDEAEPNITVKMYNETGILKRTGLTNKNGRIWFRDMADGVFNWTSADADGRFIEKGRIVIGARVQVDTDVSDFDFDGFYDDFRVMAYNNVDRGVNTVTVTVWAPNGTEVTSNLTVGGELEAINLTKGTYEFNATYLGEELANGTFYSYGNVDEPFTIVVLPEARDLDGDGRYDDVNITVVDTDDSPMEFASVYVDGVYKTKTDLDGYTEVKNLAWGIHTIEARYSGEVSETQFFSEGSTAHTATWTVLVLDGVENARYPIEDAGGSTNDTVFLYYSESIDGRPKEAHMWIVLDGMSQEVDLTRLGTDFVPGKVNRLEDDGILEGVLDFAFDHFKAQKTAAVFLTRPDFGEGFGFMDELDGVLGNISVKLGLLATDSRGTVFASQIYEVRTRADFALGYYQEHGFPLGDMTTRISTQTSTTPRALGEYIINRYIGTDKGQTVLLDMSKIPAYATALDSLTSDLVNAYPEEGWNIQDARNASAFDVSHYDDDAMVYADAMGTELASLLSTASLRSKATALANAASAVEIKTGSTSFGWALLFPNETEIWEMDNIQLMINSSELAADTSWDEFLDAFWEFRDYDIDVHATAFDSDSSGRDNDVVVFVNDTYDRALSGVRVYIDLQFVGVTDAAGELEDYNYTRGIHLVNVTLYGQESETSFYSEGTVIPNDEPSVSITDPEEDDEVSGIYDIRGTSSDPDGIVSYVEVRFNGSAWNRALGRSSWRYEWNTRDFADGTWKIEARAYDGDLYSTISWINVTVFNPVVYEDILLVDDDGGLAYEVWYIQALNAGNEDFDTISVARGDDGPDATRLKRANIVIWLTGEEGEDTLTAADVAALAEFLDDGGALFITGQDIGRDLTSDGTVTSAFMRDYLRADFITDNANDFDLIGVPGEEISGGVNISIEGGTGASNQNYPSEIQPRSGASSVFLYNSTAEAAVKYGSTTFRTVYFAFGFEGIAARSDRNTIMLAVLDWLASNGTTDPNLPPEVSAGNPVIVTEGEVAILRGTATDVDGLVALYEWDFDGDGTYDWSNGTTGRALWTYETPGNFTAKLRVTDNIGASATATVSVEVRPRPPNQEPVADAGADLEVDQGDPVEFLMAGSDLDGMVVLYEWDYEGDGTFDEVSAVPTTTVHIYYDPGVYTAVLRITDDDGATDTDDRVVTVNEKVQNQLPTADAGPDLEAQIGTEVTLIGRGNDTDGHIATFMWDFDGDGVYDLTSNSTGTAIHTYNELGEFTARLLVIDNLKAAATDTCNVTITPVHINIGPTADAGSDDIIPATQGEEMEFQGIGTDPDGFIALYEWDFDGDDIYDWNDTQARITVWTYEETGLFIARFRVTDNDGDTDDDILRVMVSSSITPNDPPTANAGGPYEGISGEVLTLTGSGSDPDGVVVSYEWDFDGDGTVDYYSPDSGTTSVTYDMSGDYNAVLYVTDDSDAVATSTAVVSIERANADPTVRLTDPSPGQTLFGYYVIRGTASDDTGISSVELRIDEGAWMRVMGTMSWTYDYDASGLVPGTHTMFVRATDVEGVKSRVVEVQFLVDEPDGNGGDDDDGLFSGNMFWLLIATVSVLIAASVILLIRFKRR